MVREALDRGLLRASQAARGEQPWLGQTGQAVVRAYRSRMDGSVQPYAVTFPADYGKDRTRWRLDVVLHGRNDDLTEAAFLHQHDGDRPAPADQDWVQIDIYGRGNNAYRWAGETDVEEAVENFLAVEQVLGRGALIDRDRFVLRGFSMGGAGTWHLGLHRPSQWCVIGPGAGFTTTHGYIKNLPDKLPPYQEACLTHLRRRRLRRERLRRSGRRLRRLRRPAIAGGPQHRGEAQAAWHPHDAARRAGAEAPVPRRVAEEGRGGVREIHRPRAGRSFPPTSISSRTL